MTEGNQTRGPQEETVGVRHTYSKEGMTIQGVTVTVTWHDLQGGWGLVMGNWHGDSRLVAMQAFLGTTQNDMVLATGNGSSGSGNGDSGGPSNSRWFSRQGWLGRW